MKKVLIFFIILISLLISSNVIAIQSIQEGKFDSEKLKELSEKDNEVKFWESVQPEIWEYLDSDHHNVDELRKIDAHFRKSLSENFRRELYLVPVKRVINKVNNFESITFTAYRYKFLLPWGNNDEMHSYDYSSWALKINKWMFVFDNPVKNSGMGTIAYEAWNPEHLDRIFYNGTPKNKYEFVNAVFNANASDLSKALNIIKRIKEKLLLWSLMLIKQGYTTEIKEPDYYLDTIYSFSEHNVKGFQVGNPKMSNRILLVLFPNENIELNIKILKGKNGKVTQDHIDFIIQNFKCITDDKE